MVAYYVSMFRGMRVPPIETVLRQLPRNRAQHFTYEAGNEMTFDVHASRVQEVLEAVQSIPRDAFAFSFILVEVPLEIARVLPRALHANPEHTFSYHIQGDPGPHLQGLLGIADMLRETPRPEQ